MTAACRGRLPVSKFNLLTCAVRKVRFAPTLRNAGKAGASARLARLVVYNVLALSVLWQGWKVTFVARSCSHEKDSRSTPPVPRRITCREYARGGAGWPVRLPGGSLRMSRPPVAWVGVLCGSLS